LEELIEESFERLAGEMNTRMAETDSAIKFNLFNNYYNKCPIM